jgi:hypothetical protein
MFRKPLYVMADHSGGFFPVPNKRRVLLNNSRHMERGGNLKKMPSVSFFRFRN